MLISSLYSWLSFSSRADPLINSYQFFFASTIATASKKKHIDCDFMEERWIYENSWCDETMRRRKNKEVKRARVSFNILAFDPYNGKSRMEILSGTDCIMHIWNILLPLKCSLTLISTSPIFCGSLKFSFVSVLCLFSVFAMWALLN